MNRGRCFVLLVLCLLGLVAIPVGAEQDWRDDIPPPEDFITAVGFSRLMFEVESTDSWDEWGEFTPRAFFHAPDDTEVGIAVLGNTIYVGFRGTDIGVPVDIWANLNAHLVNVGFVGGKAHQGYWDKVFGSWVYQSLVDEVEQAYLTHGTNFDKVAIVGHSQGGALATLFGSYYAHGRPDRLVSVSTFGSPRVGNEDFKQTLRSLPNLSIFRVVFEEDMFARLPPRFMQYRHPGHLLHLQGSGSTRAYFQQTGDPGSSYVGIHSSEWDVNYLDFSDMTDPIDDHSDSEYLEALQKAANNPSLWPTDFRRTERYCCRRILWWCRRWCDREV